ncbi:MAG: ribonuclease HI family protein [Ignavibacteria bacterium]
MSRIKVFTDGAAKGNPGPAGIGIVIYDENDFILRTYKEFLGETTNNQAEYRALLKSLDLIKKLASNIEVSFDSIEFYSDSELLVNQINFDYQTKDPGLAVLNSKFHVLAKKLEKTFTIMHIERAKNKNADMLANLAVDNKLKLIKKEFLK